LVELPGIEPATKIAVTCGTPESDDAKGVDGVNKSER
jgi:hypothetical protein